MTARVSVVMGGPSAEHEVSLASGREVLLSLDRGKYRLQAVVISRSKEFFFCDASETVPSPDELSDPRGSAVFEGPLSAHMSEPIWAATDVAFLGLHGAFGEDGLFQGFLDTIGVPYTGSKVFASALGMNKIASKRIFEAAGLRTPPSSLYGPGHPDVTAGTLAETHGFPCFVKCPQSGSSRLMGRAHDRESLEQLLQELSEHAGELLVESLVDGEEFSCPVLEYPGGSLKALPPVLIRPVGSAFFDYRAKYTAGASEEIVPAPCAEDVALRIQDTALKAHALLGCNGLSRTDMILRGGELFVLELNTLPGLTPASLAPKAFAAAGGTYSQLLDILIETALTGRTVTKT